MRDLSLSGVIKPEVRGLTAYTLKHFDAAVKLDQNENPYELPMDLKQEVVDRVLRRHGLPSSSLVLGCRRSCLDSRQRAVAGAYPAFDTPTKCGSS